MEIPLTWYKFTWTTAYSFSVILGDSELLCGKISWASTEILFNDGKKTSAYTLMEHSVHTTEESCIGNFVCFGTFHIYFKILLTLKNLPLYMIGTTCGKFKMPTPLLWCITLRCFFFLFMTKLRKFDKVFQNIFIWTLWIKTSPMMWCHHIVSVVKFWKIAPQAHWLCKIENKDVSNQKIIQCTVIFS